MSLYLAIELQSLPLYVLATFNRNDSFSSESGVKYFILGALSSGLLLYGSSLIYGFTGTIFLNEISQLTLSSNQLGITFGLAFLLAGIVFKISAVPFHMWAPDVYEGSPTPVVAFLSVGSKAAGFALAIRILVGCFSAFDTQWKLLFTVLAVLSMSLGNVVALAQKSMKRMLAYSSIGQAGFVMIGLVCGTEDGFAAMVLYMAAYLFMNLGAFACVILFSIRTGSDQISDYAGLYQKDPLILSLIHI